MTQQSILIESESGVRYQIVSEERTDLSIPLNNGTENPNCFGAANPVFEPVRGEGFVGSITEGGLINHKIMKIIPHGNGTHTECYGHISDDPGATLARRFSEFWLLADLLSVTPQQKDGDQVITAEQFQPPSLQDIRGLIVRTLPNDTEKKIRQYTGTNPPYFEAGFIDKLVEHGICHLLTDLPSVDREEDGGRLAAHKAFWPSSDRYDCTITEMIYVPDSVKDGSYWLNLQVPNIELDAAPSRPVIYPATKV